MAEMEKWRNEIKENLKNVDTSKEMERWKKRSIYRVPVCISDLSKAAYRPEVVSLGPYYHGEEYLEPMEEHKHRALLHFLKRSNKSIDSIVETFKTMVQDLKDSYDQLDLEKWQDDKFIQLMILDGCFLLEIFHFPSRRFDHYASNDPVFSEHGMLNLMTHIARDMLKLENQLPMYVLYKLADAETVQSKELVNRLIFSFFFPKRNFSPLGEHLHILDAYRKSLLDGCTSQTDTDRKYEGSITQSATDLDESGIQFQKSKTTSIEDISFQGGVLKLPFAVVDDAFESTFLNLLAFERLHAGVGSEVTSYIYFMDSIIFQKSDVALLQSRGLIENAIGSDSAVAQVFHLLAKGTALDPKSSLREVVKKIDEHCQKPWNQLRSYLVHTYVHNRCPILSLTAAIIFFALTSSQTFYTIFPYYHPRGK
ncbi:hypothetical protein GH714_007395 [Hevea brasiliensis]|uniref:Uncharacterized protein n=1 Tax=Hevea brasiliensis TaxID=3981 RepID=A0A6A6KZS5_HEVBR|nr:hypothetical protein GH714_007395 [Hevea brasiliensis]